MANSIEWVDDTIPKSTRFDDTYYSKSDGRSETSYVFLDGNQLRRRWPEMQHCTIAELGFGTGLNFLTTIREWQKLSPKDGTLNFISFELFPMAKSEIMKALSRWPDLIEDADILFAHWNPSLEFFRWQRAGAALTIFFSDANKRLPQLDIEVDAWFLDGFSPAKNPELWNVELMQTVFDKTARGGTFATYTAAGWVRRNLEAAGFKVQRIKGHAGKRQMSIGVRPTNSAEDNAF